MISSYFEGIYCLIIKNDILILIVWRKKSLPTPAKLQSYEQINEIWSSRFISHECNC